MQLTYDPTDIDECNHVKQMLKSGEYSSTLNEIYNLCRSQLKHGDCENIEQLVDLIEQIKALASEFN